MKEQLANPSHIVEPVRLTAEAKTSYAGSGPRLNRGGDIFMPDPGVGEGAPQNPQQSPEVRSQLQKSELGGTQPENAKVENGRQTLVSKIRSKLRDRAQTREVRRQLMQEQSGSQVKSAEDQANVDPIDFLRETFAKAEHAPLREELLAIVDDLQSRPPGSLSNDELQAAYDRAISVAPAEEGVDKLNPQDVIQARLGSSLGIVYQNEMIKRGMISEPDMPQAERSDDPVETPPASNLSESEGSNDPVAVESTPETIGEVLEESSEESEQVKEDEVVDRPPSEEIRPFELSAEDLDRINKAARNLPSQAVKVKDLAAKLKNMSPAEIASAKEQLLRECDAISEQLWVKDIPFVPFPDLPEPPDDAPAKERNAIEKERARLLSAYNRERTTFIEQTDLSNIGVEMGDLRGIMSKVTNAIERGGASNRVELKWQPTLEDLPINTTTMSRDEIRATERENLLRREYYRPLREAHVEIDRLLLEESTSANFRSLLDKQYEKIEKTIDKITLGDHSGETSSVFEFLAEESLLHGQILTDEDGNEVRLIDRKGKEHYGYAVEYALEKVIGRGDENATAEYPQNQGFYVSNNIDTLMESVRTQSRDFAIYLTNLRGKRVLVHELFRNLKDRKTFVEYVTRALDTGGLQFVEERVGGIPEVQAYYEKELARKTGLKGYRGEGWLLADDYFDNPDDLDKDSIDRNVKNIVTGKLFDVDRALKYGNNELIGRRPMRPWEKERAYYMGRAVTAGSQRRLIYSIYGDTPPGGSGANFIISLEAEPITSILSPLKFDANRWKGQPIAKRFREHFFKYKRDRAREKDMRYGIDGDVTDESGKKTTKRFGMYGASEDGTVMIDTGIHDPKSTWWREEKIFLGQPEYMQEIDGKKYTVSGYFDALKERARKKYERGHRREEEQFEKEARGDKKGNIRRRFFKSHRKQHDIEHALNHELHHNGFLEKQRLFLGVLLRRNDLDAESKEILWKTTADLIPSRISALMPQYAMEEVKKVFPRHRGEQADAYENRIQEQWDQTMRKLSIVEHDRMRRDAEGFKTKTNGDRLDPGYTGNTLDHHIGEYNQRVDRLIAGARTEEDRRLFVNEGLTGQQVDIIHKWQALGKGKADQLATLIAPHAIFLDDAPITAWNLMGRTDLDRILVGDQSGFAEAYAGAIGVIANPAIQYEKALEPMAAFVHTVQNILSLSEAQELVEPFLVSYLEMSRKYTVSKFIPGRGLLRKADSEIEEFNPEANIAYEDGELLGILQTSAQQEIISDDPTEVKKDMPNFEIMRKASEAPVLKHIMRMPIAKQVLFKGETPFLRIKRRQKLDTKNIYNEKLGILLLIFGPLLATAILKAILPEEIEKNI